MTAVKSSFEQELERNGILLYRNAGDSMEPLIRQGKTLLVIEKKPDRRLCRYDVPLYRRDSGQYVLHRIIRVRKHDYVLCGDNRWQKETGITDAHIIGVLTAVTDTETGKKTAVTDPEYLRYVKRYCTPQRRLRLWLCALPGRFRRLRKRIFAGGKIER